LLYAIFDKRFKPQIYVKRSRQKERRKKEAGKNVKRKASREKTALVGVVVAEGVSS